MLDLWRAVGVLDIFFAAPFLVLYHDIADFNDDVSVPWFRVSVSEDESIFLFREQLCMLPEDLVEQVELVVRLNLWRQCQSLMDAFGDGADICNGWCQLFN